MHRRHLVLLATVTLIFAGAPSGALGDEIPYWPSEQDARLEELDAELVETQEKLFAARQKNDADATASLTQTVKDCQEKRMKLLRAMGHLRSQN